MTNDTLSVSCCFQKKHKVTFTNNPFIWGYTDHILCLSSQGPRGFSNTNSMGSRRELQLAARAFLGLSREEG